MKYFKGGLQGFLQNYLNDAVNKGISDVKAIKSYAENEYKKAGHTPLLFLDKHELYKTYFGND
jgi:hypothetical protein